jgi:ribonucleoside-diphosphate reductase alpha chain
MGRGNSDEAFEPTPAPSDYAVSNGYVRGSLSVIEGGRMVPESLDGSELEAHAGATGTDGVLQMEAEIQTEIVKLTQATGKQLDLEYIVQEERTARIRNARLKGYEGDACTECGNFTMVRNGTCLKCDTCGTTSGCS